MIFEGNNFMNVYNLRFFSSIMIYSYTENDLQLKYLLKTMDQSNHVTKLYIYSFI